MSILKKIYNAIDKFLEGVRNDTRDIFCDTEQHQPLSQHSSVTEMNEDDSDELGSQHDEWTSTDDKIEPEAKGSTHTSSRKKGSRFSEHRFMFALNNEKRWVYRCIHNSYQSSSESGVKRDSDDPNTGKRLVLRDPGWGSRVSSSDQSCKSTRACRQQQATSKGQLWHKVVARPRQILLQPRRGHGKWIDCRHARS